MIVIKGNSGKMNIVEAIARYSPIILFCTDENARIPDGIAYVKINTEGVLTIKGIIEKALDSAEEWQFKYAILYTNKSGFDADALESMMQDIEKEYGFIIKEFIMTRM